MGHYELITACFLGKLALKKHFFEVHTPKFANPSPPIVHTCCDFFLLFVLVASQIILLKSLNSFLINARTNGHIFCLKSLIIPLQIRFWDS